MNTARLDHERTSEPQLDVDATAMNSLMGFEPSTTVPAASLAELSINALRFLSVDAVQKANSGHPGLNMRHESTILAYEMNGEALSVLHGAPSRLRCENELYFKMVN